MATIRLTLAQAVVRFLAQQHSERDEVQQWLIPGCFGIFGHGNVAGVSQALLQVIYSEAAEQLRRFAAATGIPVADTQAGKGALPWITDRSSPPAHSAPAVQFQPIQPQY